MKERKTWTKQEDDILRFLKEVRGQKKWSAIAKKMEEQFSVSGRSGKQCRQRYHNHLDSTIKLTEWTPEQERVLFEMHDEVGNRWSVISHRLPGRQKYIQKRTDNGVKNHFYSKLRKAVRRINKIISQNYKKEYKEIKTSLLYKIIETSESKFKVSSMIDEQVADYCTQIKNKLYYFEQNFIQSEEQHIEALKTLIEDILNFGKNDKRIKIKHRKSSGAGKDLLHPNMYLKKVRSNSEYSSSQVSSHFIESSSYGDDSDGDENISLGHKSMMQLSKKETNPSRSYTSNSNLRLTRSRSKEETFSTGKSPQCYSDDANNSQKLKFHAFTGDHFLSTKSRLRNPSFEHQKSSDWSQHAIEQALMQDNVIEQKSSGSNKFSRNSRSNSERRSHVNLFFEDSQFQMRILSPKNFHQEEKMSEQQLFNEPRMQLEVQVDMYSVDSIKTLNLGNQLCKFALGEKEIQDAQKRQKVDHEDMEKEPDSGEKQGLFGQFESDPNDSSKGEKNFFME